MKNIRSLSKFAFIILAITIASCSSTKKVASGQRDGSSFETAIVVKSVSAEYEYVKKVCPDCKFLGQSLINNEKKPYDVLRFVRPNGKEVSYYFDISSFYGKMFGL